MTFVLQEKDKKKWLKELGKKVAELKKSSKKKLTNKSSIHK